jgi:hypothetical protein
MAGDHWEEGESRWKGPGEATPESVAEVAAKIREDVDKIIERVVDDVVIESEYIDG